MTCTKMEIYLKKASRDFYYKIRVTFALENKMRIKVGAKHETFVRNICCNLVCVIG